MNYTSESLYVLLPNEGCEWEDIRIFVNKEDAQKLLDLIENKSKSECNWRIEIFEKQSNNSYRPSYKVLKM